MFAALSSNLLARKGQAKPAMRRQAALVDSSSDLGWNDLGDGAAELPPVLVERQALAAEVAEPVSPEPSDEAPSVATPVEQSVAETPAETAARVEQAQRATVRTGKAAFTLRLDAERHLRLRLASATRHRSAQSLVTEALDAFLATMPEVEALARRLPSDD